MADNIEKPIDKDSDYNSTIGKMRDLLKKSGFEIEESSLKNPVKGIWSVHIKEKRCPSIYTNGKGATKEAALASGLGEFFERISCNYLFSDYYLGEINRDFVFYEDEIWLDGDNLREKALNEELWSFYGDDLEFEDLIEFNSGRDEVCAIPFTEEKDRNRIFFPVNILDNIYVSNGMAAGNSIHEARVQALSEIIERHVKFRVIGEGIALPKVPDWVLEKYPSIMESVSKLKEKGFDIIINDCSLGGKYPVININLINSDGGVFSAFGAHPFLKTAMERTLTELMQGRDTEQFKDLKKPSMDMALVSSPQNLEEHFIDSAGYVSFSIIKDEPDYEYGFIDFQGNTKEQYEYLLKIFDAEKKKIYIADYDHFGIYCCRIIVPDFSEIYPVSDLFENNRNHRCELREMIIGCDYSVPDDIEALYSFILDEEFELSSDIFELTGILGDHFFPVCELLFQLSLLMKNFEEALMWFDSIDMEMIPAEKRKLYDAVSLLIQLEEESEINQRELVRYMDFVYGKEVIKSAKSLINGSVSLLNKGALSSALSSEKHSAMLDLYGKKGVKDPS